MHDLEHDEMAIPAAGPGRRAIAQGPVDAVYADADMHLPCPGCGTNAFEYCRHPSGALRRIPCSQRISKDTHG